MAIAKPGGGLELAKDYWVSFPEGYRAHQIRLDGGDCSTDHSAIRRFEFERSGLDACLALAGCRRERPLPRRKSGNGVAARRFGGIDGTAVRRALVSALWPLAAGHLLAMLLVILPFALLDHIGGMAAPDPARRQPPCHRLRYLPAGRPKPSTGAGADSADAIGAVVLCGRHRAWRGTDAGADLSRALQGSRPRQGPRGGREPHQRQSCHGGAGRHRPRRRDDRCRRVFGVAGLPLSRSQIRIAELVQSGYGSGPSASFWSEPSRWCSALRGRANAIDSCSSLTNA